MKKMSAQQNRPYCALFRSFLCLERIMGTLLIIWKQMIRSTSGRFHKERTLQTKKH